MSAKPAGRRPGILLAGILLAACGGRDEGRGPDRLDPSVLRSPATTALSQQAVVTMQRAALADTVEVPVSLRADERAGVVVTAPAGGRLESVRVRTADQAVAAGETLALLYSPELVAAQREHLLLDPRREAGLIRQSEERLARMGLAAAQIAALRRTRKPLERIPIRSPRAGFLILEPVASREGMAMPGGSDNGAAPDGMGPAMGGMGGMGGGAEAAKPGAMPAPAAESGFRAGAYVTRGQALVQVNPLTTVAAVLSLPVASAALFRAGDSVHLELPSIPYRGKARLDFLEARVADTGGNVQARVHLENPGFRLRPGDLGKARLAPPADSAWVLPRAAVHDLGERHLAWVRSAEDTGAFRAREVRVGRAGPSRVEILEGLEPGEAVAANASLLVDPDVVLEPLPISGAGIREGATDSAGGAETDAARHAGHAAADPQASADPHAGHAASGPEIAAGPHAGHGAPGGSPAALVVPEAEALRAGVGTALAAPAHLVPSRVFRAVTRFDESSREVVAARVEGWLVDVAVPRPGERVARGQELATLRSETLQSAQEEYLAARRKAAGLADPDLVKAQLQAARRRLQVLGMEAGRIASLDRSGRPLATLSLASPRDGIVLEARAQPGQYVTEGLPLFSIGRADRILVETWLLATEASSFPEGTEASVRIEGLPGPMEGRLIHLRREASLGGSAVLACVDVGDSGGRILPGLQAWVTLPLPWSHAEVAVPPSALLRSSRHTMAWVRVGREAYAPRRVETGLETPEAVEILSGIRAGDEVVVSGAYLLDSEWSYRQGAAQAHAGH